MKTLGIIAGIIILIIIVALVVIPIAFKPQITNLVRDQAGKSINADVNFTDIGIGLLTSFPNARVTVNKITIVNRAPFAGDTLASLDKFEIVINPWRYLSSKQIEILSLNLDRPDIFLVTLKDGRSNFMILPETKQQSQTQAQPAAPMNLAIRQYGIKDGRVVYANDSTGLYAQVVGLNHQGKGDFAKSVFTLATRTKIDSLSLRMGNISYLKNAELDMKADIGMDMNAKKYTFSQNEIKLNQLAIAFDGWVQQSGQNIDMDLTFKTPSTDFKSLLSMIPAIYRKDLKGLEAQGQFSLAGKLKGTYGKDRVPLIDARLLVDNGMFEYSQIKTPVKNVAIDLQIHNPGRTIDDTEIDLRKFHLEILDEPVDAQLLVKTPVSNPYVDGFLKGNINLANVRKLVPMSDSIQLDGMVRSDFKFRGNISSIQNKQLGNFDASGTLKFANIKYAAPTLPEPVAISTANLTFTPAKAVLENFSMQMGNSDLKASGGLDNVIGYALGGQTLTGSLAVNSNHLDLTPFMQVKGGPLQAVELPAKMDIQMTGTFGEVILDKMNMTNVKGRLQLKDQTLTLTDLSANMLGGSMISNGSYAYIKPAAPHINFDLKLSQLSIPDMYKTFMTVQQFAPMAEFVKGQINGTLNLNSDMGKEMTPLWQTIISQGALQIPQAQIMDLVPLNKVADVLGLADLKNPVISNLDPSYEIKDGFFHLKPMGFKVGSYEIVASGSSGLDKSLDYSLKIPIPASQLKSGVNAALSGIVGKNMNLMGDESVIVNVGIKGAINDPKITTSMGDIVKGATKQVQQQLEQQAQQKLDQQKSAVEDSLKNVVKSEQQKQTEDLKNKIKGLFGK